MGKSDTHMKQKGNTRKYFVIVLTLSALFFQSCFLDCSYREKIEFNNSSKSIRVLSDNYCIISVKLTEYEPMEGYIREIENNTVKVDINEEEHLKNVDLHNLLKVKESDFNQALIDKKYIAYDIVLHVIEPKSHSEETKYIHFVSEQVEKGEKIFESEGCK